MKIRDWLTDESKWIKYSLYADASNIPVKFPEKAYKACLVGTIHICYPKRFAEIFHKIVNKIGGDGPYLGVSFWNDAPKTTFEDVRKLIEELDI